MDTCITLYVADQYGPGCPSNGSGHRVGYGLTAKQAVAACEPWGNQAAFFRRRARAVLLSDGRWLGEDDVWALLGLPTGHEVGAHAEAIAAAERMEWTTAIAKAVEAGLIAAVAHRPRRDPSVARVTRSYSVHPDTVARIAAEAKRSGESAGQVVDRLTAGLGR